MKTVLLDTNFLLLPASDGIDVYGELGSVVGDRYELATLSSVKEELEKMGRSRSKRGIASRVALSLLERNGVKVVETGLPADESILQYALGRKDVIVCTNDKELKQKLRRGGVQVISPKGRSRIAFV